MEQLIEALDVSDCVTVIPTAPEDFFNYDTLFKGLYRDLARKVKQNHIFSCTADNRMDLHESNIGEHNNKCTHKLSKKGRLMKHAAELKAYTAAQLFNVECVGINPYKMVELHSKYGPQIPKEYRKNILYRKPDAKVMALVKDERSERSVFRARLTESKLAGMKARLESIAYLDDDGNDVVDNEEEEGDGGGEEGVREEDDNDGPGSTITMSMRETTAE